MKKLAFLALAVTSLSLSTGCSKTYRLENDFGSTPAYSSRERWQRIQRGWDYDIKEMNDDVDTVLMLGQPSHLTIWNIR
jgi:hypothetical protein